jgi:serine protease Do
MRLYENDFSSNEFNKDNFTRTNSAEPQGYEYEYESLDQCESCHTSHINASRPYIFSRKGISILITLCLLVSVLFGIGGALLAANLMDPVHHTFGTPQMRFAPMHLDLAEATRSSLSIQEIVDVAGDSVVEISTERARNSGFMMQQISHGAGSGVIISTDGYIMTNSHVVEDSNQIRVTLANGEVHSARLVGIDRSTDVAVIKINTTGLRPIIFGNSDGVLIGDLAVVIGNPLGDLGGTTTAGIISALNRQLTVEGRNLTVIQTDAAINQGNSGGGLFNQHGELVGLVVAKTKGPGVEGLGFAIPINIAKPLAMNIIENGFVAGRPQIGIEMANLTSSDAMAQHNTTIPGIYIHRINSENARAAGLREGDMLYSIENIQIGSFNDVRTIVQSHNVGDTITIIVIRDGEFLEIPVVLSEQRPN